MQCGVRVLDSSGGSVELGTGGKLLGTQHSTGELSLGNDENIQTLESGFGCIPYWVYLKKITDYTLLNDFMIYEMCSSTAVNGSNVMYIL